MARALPDAMDVDDDATAKRAEGDEQTRALIRRSANETIEWMRRQQPEQIWSIEVDEFKQKKLKNELRASENCGRIFIAKILLCLQPVATQKFISHLNAKADLWLLVAVSDGCSQPQSSFTSLRALIGPQIEEPPPTLPATFAPSIEPPTDAHLLSKIVTDMMPKAERWMDEEFGKKRPADVSSQDDAEPSTSYADATINFTKNEYHSD